MLSIHNRYAYHDLHGPNRPRVELGRLLRRERYLVSRSDKMSDIFVFHLHGINDHGVKHDWSKV